MVKNNFKNQKLIKNFKQSLENSTDYEIFNFNSPAYNPFFSQMDEYLSQLIAFNQVANHWIKVLKPQYISELKKDLAEYELILDTNKKRLKNEDELVKNFEVVLKNNLNVFDSDFDYKVYQTYDYLKKFSNFSLKNYFQIKQNIKASKNELALLENSNFYFTIDNKGKLKQLETDASKIYNNIVELFEKFNLTPYSLARLNKLIDKETGEDDFALG